MNTSPLTGGKARRRAPLPFSITLFLFLFSSAGACAQPQARQPVLSSKVEKTAYLDHARLRGGYTAFRAALEQGRAAWEASEQAHGKQLGELQGRSERLALEQAQRERRKHLLESRSKALQALETNIAEAVREVVSEGGYTAVRPLKKGKAPLEGSNVTDLVLQKLN